MQPLRRTGSVRFRFVVVTLSVLAVLGAEAAQVRTRPGVNLTLQERAFAFSAHQALQGKVMGYSFLLMRNGRLVTESSGGNARNAADGLEPMTTRTPQNLGSLFKFIAGISLLHLFERPPAGSAGGEGTVTSRLDAPAALLYPRAWLDAIATPAIRTLTYRQLLQHRSGFRGCSGGNQPIDCFSRSFSTRLIGVRDYENINFALIGYAIGVYTKPSLQRDANANKLAGSSSAEREATFRLEAGRQMDEVIRRTVFPLVPGTISASCDAANDYRTTGAYSYKSATDTGKGIITSRVASNVPCVGSGGYWMSIRDFAAFAATALHSNALLSAQTRRLLYHDRMAPDDRLVWSFTTSDSWIASKFGMDTIIYSGGDQPYGGGQGAHTAIVRLPLDYEVLVFANSDELGSNDLARIGINAFRAGLAHNF